LYSESDFLKLTMWNVVSAPARVFDTEKRYLGPQGCSVTYTGGAATRYSNGGAQNTSETTA
jgi:hypothetical protein